MTTEPSATAFPTTPERGFVRLARANLAAQTAEQIALAAAPIIAVVALNLAYLIVGVVVIEVVFVYPGVGQLMVDAVSKRDLPVVQACGLIFAGAFVLLNTAADILAILVNPRLRLPR